MVAQAADQDSVEAEEVEVPAVVAQGVGVQVPDRVVADRAADLVVVAARAEEPGAALDLAEEVVAGQNPENG